MFFLQCITLLTAIWYTAFSPNVLAQFTPPSAPALQFRLSGTVDLSPTTYYIPGPLGTRISGGFTGGQLKDHTNTVIGSVVAGFGAENGIVDANGVLHLDARITISLTDGKTAYFNFISKGVAGQTNYFYLSVETDSTTFGYLNPLFLFGQSTIANGVLSYSMFST